jgi:hypothetical protein
MAERKGGWLRGSRRLLRTKSVDERLLATHASSTSPAANNITSTTMATAVVIKRRARAAGALAGELLASAFAHNFTDTEVGTDFGELHSSYSYKTTEAISRPILTAAE